jgi:ketosteroid isomerase-like protein
MTEHKHPVLKAIEFADAAIVNEYFDELMSCYTEDAVLIVKPGLQVQGKEKIRAAFVKIAEYFSNRLRVSQGNQLLVEAGDTVLVLSETFVDFDDQRTTRKATYVYKKSANGKWLCCIDNSYGTALLD